MQIIQIAQLHVIKQ